MSFELKNKKIIFLLNSPELGGAERQALTLAGYLQNKMSCDVTIYCCINRVPSEIFKKALEDEKLKCFNTVKNPLVASKRLKSLKIKLKLFQFGLMLRKHKPDVIIPYLNKQSIIAIHCRRVAGAKLTFWNNRGHEFYRKDNLERRTAKKTNFFLVNSLDSKVDIINHLNVLENKIYFIPNFLTIRTKRNDPVADEVKTELTIGMLAHFRSEKLHLLLLSAFLELLKRYPNLKLHLVGSFAEEIATNNILNFITENNIHNKVSILSNISGEQAIPHFDIAVLVSLKEGMSNSLMEYMYFRKPIVCSSISGNEFLLGKGNQFLVENKDSDLIYKLELLIKDEELRVFEGTKNYDRITKNFGIEEYIKKLEGVINEHLS